MSGYEDFATHIAGNHANGKAKRWFRRIAKDSRGFALDSLKIRGFRHRFALDSPKIYDDSSANR